MSRKALIASAGAAVTLAAGTGGAYAAGGFGSTGTADGGGDRVFVVKAGPGVPPGAEAIAAYLGLTESELRTQLEAGKTLAEIATAQGKSVSGLEAVMYAQAKSHLDQAVADGKLTAAQEETMLAGFQSHLDEIVTHNGPVGERHVAFGIFGTGVASYLGLSEDQLRTQIESGKSLADIAAAQGKSVDGLKSAILAEARSHLDEAVAAGRLTKAQAEQMLDDLTSHVDDLVNRTGPPPLRRAA